MQGQKLMIPEATPINLTISATATRRVTVAQLPRDGRLRPRATVGTRALQNEHDSALLFWF